MKGDVVFFFSKGFEFEVISSKLEIRPQELKKCSVKFSIYQHEMLTHYGIENASMLQTGVFDIFMIWSYDTF